MKPAVTRYLPHLVLLVFAFILYGNTLTYDYTLDDLIVIQDNAFTTKGIAGIGKIFSYDSFTGFFGTEKKLVAGGRYRPLSIATFAVEYSLAGGLNPFLSHLVNILLYALTGIFIFLIFGRLMKPPKGNPWYLGAGFIAAALFMAHPVHTEAVANIKGRDEILALLFPLMSLDLVVRYFEKGNALRLALANFLFFLGLLSKENAVMFVVLVPLTIFVFTRVSLKKNLLTSLSFLMTAVIFVFIRFLVLGYLNSGELPRELLNNPFLEASAGQKFGAIFYTLGLYIRLLFFPLTLTHDYYPYHIPLVSLTEWRSLVPAALYAALLIYALARLPRRDVAAYGILFYLITLFLVSNLLFPVGTFMNERFIYMPSLGFVIIVAWLIQAKLPLILTGKSLYRASAVSLVAVTLLLFTVRTVARNRVWKDNFTLFTTDVQVSENSIKCNVSAGGDYQKKAMSETDSVKRAEYYEHSVRYLEKAISIYPKAINGLLLYGNVLSLYKKDYKGSILYYEKTLEIDPYNTTALKNTLQILGTIDNGQEAHYKTGVLRRLLRAAPDDPEVNYNLGKIYGQFLGNLDSASYFLERAVSLAPENVSIYKDLGIVCSLKGDYARALEIFSKARKLDPADEQIRQNIQLTHRIMQEKGTIR